MLSVQNNALAVYSWQGIGIICHGMKGVKSMDIPVWGHIR
jgi:hypothetical protein